MSGGEAEGAAGRPARKIYVKHGPQTWARARERYLAGRTAGQVAAELGCSIAAVRAQASRGGWTRRDAAAGAGVGGVADGAAEAAGGAGAGGSAPARSAPTSSRLSPPSSPPSSLLSSPLGEGRFDPPALPSARPDGRAEHLRLTPEAWAVIRGERLNGASIAALAAKWKVSEGTIRRHAGAEGWTNTDRGEAVSRAMVEEAIAARAFAEGREAAEREAAARADAKTQEAAADAEEADPLEAARTLLRRAAASAVAGRLAQAGAGVKLAEGLARAAAALGLGGEVEDGWGEEDEPRLTPEALEALRDDVERRYARFDRPEPGEEGGVTPRAEADEAPIPPPLSRLDDTEEPPPPSASGPDADRVPWPPSPPQRGISQPSRSLSVSPWPAWAGPPDAWPRSAWGA